MPAAADTQRRTIDVPEQTYLDALFGVYELNRVEGARRIRLVLRAIFAPLRQSAGQVRGGRSSVLQPAGAAGLPLEP